jgi:hypothetical protein
MLTLKGQSIFAIGSFLKFAWTCSGWADDVEADPRAGHDIAEFIQVQVLKEKQC